ncbi:DUF3572 domain-containing protein [Paragemmobacter straminiformis]|uniref:DUF3572 domain-containing protein n=1 Tax=Paragemmobacter straminiformis TaxID=2045119 RepID=A0A842IBZ2_9RHOB|nr:DUF3572 domain-containing protein [Gemmobacter straminiformis]MBC2837096.1 DUF3572 domain-containing protein [Gemmobacter straminiformis]
MRQEQAETVGLQALAWLAGEDELFGSFLGASGAGAEDVAAAAGRPEFLGSVLDFVMMEDAWVMAFCDASGLAYTVPMAARAALPGGQTVHWT